MKEVAAVASSGGAALMLVRPARHLGHVQMRPAKVMLDAAGFRLQTDQRRTCALLFPPNLPL